MQWETVIGLEIHTQLLTRSKIFSGASTAFGAEPNTQACVIDLGMPGVLPVLNRQAVVLAVKFGRAIEAEIGRRCVFARKNYFYPDLPKGYQISQLELPIVGQGHVEIVLDDVKVSGDRVLGEVGKGLTVAFDTLDGGRIGIAAQAVGIAQGAFEEALAYAQEREQFGRSIASFQAIQHYLADMATELDAARLLTWKAAWTKENRKRFTLEAAQAKLFASEMAQHVTNKALQIHGGYGYIREYNVERYFRDARITEIYEGTSEIQKLVISDWVLNKS